ncbi:acyltransferase family protein [Aquipuribacter hungaricus]|uniref:Acyltransferase family protein n=1 Tax=Aquipuribacter hungaricus TaxID=545624 RepID=A0ABV7WGM8_9MICO
MTSTAAPAVPSGYRPALDGLRGVAIVLVVLDHVWSDPPVRVGPTGVTLFFALSGYLITGILLDEHARTGAVRLGRFYLRRAARLLPALLVAVLVCDVLFVLAGDRASVVASVWGLAYVANYVIAVQGEYLPGWAQTWSLAVEEHFYLLWPLLLLLLLRRRSLRTALLGTLALCAASVLWRLYLLLAPWAEGYDLLLVHGSLARADALLYGCAAAVAVRLGWRLPRGALWPAAAVVAVLTVLTGGSGWFLVAGQAVLSVAATVVVLAVDGATRGSTGSGVRRALSWRPLVLTGVVSYGLYLWHYPLIYVAFALGLGGSVGGRAVAGILVAGLASWASYRLVEKPVRTWVRANEDRLLRRRDRAVV